MTNKIFKRSLAGIAFLLILTLGIACIWPAPSAPTTMKTLDLSLTQNEFYINEENYALTMQNEVEPFIDYYKNTGYFTSFDETNLYYEQYLQENSTAHITISHGFTETSQKYKEVIYYFLKSGYSVSILDHRGHGFSERMVDDASKVHIDTFDTYLSDLKTFMDCVVIPSTTDLPNFLFAHSMGGGIGALFIERYPDYFDAAVLSSPMMEIDTGSYPKPIAQLITNLMVLFGQGESYLFGHGPYDGNHGLSETSTTSEVRYDYIVSKKEENKALQTNGGTFNWFKSGADATKELTKNAEDATIPILLFQSENDDMVLPGGQYTFAKDSLNTTLIQVPNAEHEIYFESNDVMIPYFNTLLNFFKENIA